MSWGRRTMVSATLAAAVALVLPGAASAAPRAPTPVGYDISYPQCGNVFPNSQAFGIVGVNYGLAWSTNPCLGTEYNWAIASRSSTTPKVSFYLNTGNPGPTSPHWVLGALPEAPKACDGVSWTPDCSYDYGWYAAQDSFHDASLAIGGGATTNDTAAAAVPWWLDVESANSWSKTDPSVNIADLQGAIDFLMAAHVHDVGLYANSSSWQAITGSTTLFSQRPSWVPGARSAKQAQGMCGTTAVTGSKPTYVQYPDNNFDADYVC